MALEIRIRPRGGAPDAFLSLSFARCTVVLQSLGSLRRRAIMSHPSTPGPAPTAQAGSTPSILLQPLPPSAPSPPASVPPATPRITSSGTPPIDFSGLINGGIFGASVTFGAFAQVAATGSEPVLSLTFIAWAFAAFTLSFVLALWYGTLLSELFSSPKDEYG